MILNNAAYKATLTFILLLAFLQTASGQQAGVADRKRILVYSRNGTGYVHENLAASNQCFRMISEELGLNADVTDDPNAFTPSRLAGYAVVIFANTNNQALVTDDQRLAFRRYMESGGRFMGIHSALGTERKWKWFKDMIGGTFDSHPPSQEARIVITDPAHPSMQGLPKTWTKRDECYFLKETRAGSRVLMQHDLTAIKDPGTVGEKIAAAGKTYPAVWTDRFDGGLTWITALGHESKDYADPVFIRHLTNGLKFLLSEKIPPSKPYAITKDDPIRKK